MHLILILTGGKNMNFDQIINRKNTYCTQWDFIEDRFGDNDILPFSISDTDFAIPKEIINTLSQRLIHPIFGYTRWNHNDFKEPIVKHYLNRFACQIDINDIIYSPSVMYSISLLIRLLSNINDRVLVLDPMYDAFIKVVKENGRKLICCPLQNNNAYQIDFSVFEKQIKECSIFLFCSPHNPTGHVFSEKELKKIINICKKHNVWIISDEIHSDIVLFSNVHRPIIKYFSMYSKMCLVNSASKTFNTPGLGGSYAIVLDKELQNKFLLCTKERDFVNSANNLGMLALMSAYNNCDYYIDELILYVESNMNLLDSFLKNHLPMIKFIKPQATYLAWLNVSELGYTPDEIQFALVKVGKVAIMNGEIYGANGRKFLRMNLGCPKKKLEEGLKRLKVAIDFLLEEEEC